MEGVLKKIISLWEAFQAIFAKEGPKILKDFFFASSPKAFAICQFMCHVLGIFNKTIDALQVYFK
jgi:hypothetical protein